MDCHEARRGLWPPERPRLVGAEVAAARRHVDACPECTEYFAQDRALLDLYDRIRTERAPLQVRERVYDAISHARWARASTREVVAAPTLRRMTVPLSLVLALGAIALLQGGPEAGPPDDSAMFVEDYLRRAVGQDHIETDDVTEVRRFLERELGMRVQPLRQEGLRISRVEICLLEGRRGAMIVYERDGPTVTHYLVPQDGEWRPPALSTQAIGNGGAEMPVVIWSTPHVEQALVGEVDSDQLLRIARAGSSD